VQAVSEKGWSVVEGELADFVRGRYPALLRRALLLTGDPGHAEDLVQESLAKLWLAGRRQHIDNPEGYVLRIMVNGSVSRWRRLRPVDTVAAGRDDQLGGTDAADRVVEQDQMWRAIQSLPARQRAVVVLRFYEDLPEERIAEFLGVARGTVRSQMAKARVHLRSIITDTEGADR
jgi:RNA polymerase sigma-70 factor, ECF subfamily